MAVTTTPLGFKKPDDLELFRDGNEVIADNADKAEEVLQDVLGRFAALANPYNIGLDVDGVPYYDAGASGLSLEADTDGVPYFI